MPLGPTEVTVQFVLLFLPGITATWVVHAMTFLRRPPPYLFVLHSVLLGLSSYVVYALILRLVGLFIHGNPRVVFLENLSTAGVTVAPIEVAAATGLGFVLGVVLSVIVERDLVHRLGRGLGITRQFPEERLWGHMFRNITHHWVVARDLDQDLAYEGWLAGYSEGVDPNELLLRDARVFRNSTGRHLYDTAAVFLSRSSSGVTLEFRVWPFLASLKEETNLVERDG